MPTSSTVLAISAVATIIGGVFLWIVNMVVKAAITDANNGFKTRIALVEKELHDVSCNLEKETDYSHGVMHDRINKIGELQLDAFNAGRAMGRTRE